MRLQRILALALLLLFGAVATLSAQKRIEPQIQSPTTFAIIIDSISFERAEAAVLAYKEVVEEDGLGTYIIIDTWDKPEKVRNLLQDLYNQEKSPIEGCVLIGDIPIPMLQDAQHLTSAFKMDQQKYPWERSSVPSDRYYDTFQLKFDFLKQDEEATELFYYSLRYDSAQSLDSEIYSARIRPYDRDGVDRYTLLNEYLTKVVKERRQNRYNVIDEIFMFRGHGTNSESVHSWADEQMALKEQFPLVFSTKGRIKTMDHDNRWPMKPHILTALQEPTLDLALFHNHGSVRKQHINGYRLSTNATAYKEELKRSGRAKARQLSKKETEDDAIEQAAKALDIPRSWIEDAFATDMVSLDEDTDAMLDITPEEICAITPAANLIILDACFNGAFQHNGHIAENYIFNDGATIAVQANSVNVIQDKWPNHYLGLLSGGLRVGNWHKMVSTLETHLFGDPTFRFANSLNLTFDLNQALVEQKSNPQFWLDQFQTSESVDLQGLSLRMLYQMGYKDISNLLQQTYYSAHSGIVRLEAIDLLSQLRDPNLLPVLKDAVDDSYELIRRRTIELIGLNGSPDLAPALVYSLLWDTTSERIRFKYTQATALMPTDTLRAILDQKAAEAPYYSKEHVEAIHQLLDKNEARFTETLSTILPNDKESKTKANKIFELRAFRNNPSAKGINALLTVANDATEDAEVRIVAIEALGWYKHSYQRENIIKALKPTTNDPNSKIANEAKKSIYRLL